MRRATAADLAALVAAAHEDGHRLVLPDHVFERAGQITGAASLDVAGLALGVWFHTQRMKAIGTVKMIREMEKHVAQRHNWVVAPVSASSPIAPLMSGLGYQNLGGFNLHLKQLA